MADKKTLFALGGAAFAAAASVIYLTAPARAGAKMREPFEGRNFAHRGLHSVDKTVPENSLPAFAAAAEHGYGVELDVHITRDGRLVVFHDDDLLRMCGVEGKIEEWTYDDLRELRLLNTDCHIPLFSEVLSLIAQRCPMIVELKRGGRNNELCAKTYELLREFRGVYCIESFDPRIVGWFRVYAPEVLRGQLSEHPSSLNKGAGRLCAFALGNLLTNFIARPHFIAYGLGKKTLTARLCGLLGAMKIAWTSHGAENEAKNDAVIFEFYRPAVKYEKRVK